MSKKWKYYSISEISDVIGGYAFKSSQMKQTSNKYQIIKMSNLYKGVLDLCRNPSFWDDANKKEKDFLLKEQDILITLTGTVGKRDYGYTVQINDEKNLLLNQRVCRIRPQKSKVDSYFLFQTLRSNHFLKTYFDNSIGGTGNQSNVSITALKLIEILLPPLPEQRAIADVLSTWDEAIEKTEQLIQIKEKQFKGLLHKLITNGSSADSHIWKKVKLGDICNITMGTSPNSSHYNKYRDGLPLLQGKTDLKNRASFPRIYTKEITKRCYVGDLLLSVRAPVGYISRSMHQCCIGRGIASLKVSIDSIPDYIFYQLLASEQKWIRISQGGTFDSISRNEVEGFTLYIPPIEQQREIAGVLNAAQGEIDLLKKLVEKYKEQKRGLMQKLLTGQWRVKTKDYE